MGATTSKAVTPLYCRHCVLWKADRSPACRTVLMAIDAMKLCISEVDLDLDKGEHRYPEIIRLNPLQTVPILKDRGLILSDSRAIATYLASSYCNDGRLLPRSPAARALTDQILHYDSQTLYPRFRAAAYPILYDTCGYVMPGPSRDIQCAYAELECFLCGRNWFGGAAPTLADIAVAATISTCNVLVPIDPMSYPGLSCWLYRMSQKKYYMTGNQHGLEEFTKRLMCRDTPCKVQNPRSSDERRIFDGPDPPSCC